VEFGQKSQFVIITHNKKTVSGARTLLGVTMQESGVSRLITMRLDGQEQSDEEPVKAGR
jgi:chromosome segregation protein